MGWALDTIGPRRTVAWLLGIFGGAGALVFGLASAPWHIHVAMALIGVGCSPVLMSAYYIFGRVYPPAIFATLAGAIIGVGTLGNLAGAWPLARAVEAFGWRESLFALAAVTVIVALALARFVQDPPALGADSPKGSLWDVFRIRALWLILPLVAVNYAPAAGLRGLWVGPYMIDVFGASVSFVGTATMLMALAMVVGSFAYGPMDRLFGTRKGVVLVGNLGAVAALLALWALGANSQWGSIALLSVVGMLGLSFPLIMAHGRSFFPPHLLGRGVTLLNMFSIGGVGVLQVVSKRVWSGAGGGVAAYEALFLFFALLLLAGCAIYAFSRDRTD